jgi:single-strand DNA-binding protein
MIKLQVIGNLGKDCLTNSVNGKSVINFNVAHTEKFKDSQGQVKEKTTWVECAYWTDRTAVAQYLRRGTQVFVEGTPEVRHYTKNDGTQGASLSLRVSMVQLLGQKTENGAGGQQSNGGYSNNGNNGGYNNGNNNNYNQQPAQQNSYSSAPATADVEDDLPF